MDILESNETDEEESGDEAEPDEGEDEDRGGAAGLDDGADSYEDDEEYGGSEYESKYGYHRRWRGSWPLRWPPVPSWRRPRYRFSGTNPGF